jgi:hypothetical protein
MIVQRNSPGNVIPKTWLFSWLESNFLHDHDSVPRASLHSVTASCCDSQPSPFYPYGNSNAHTRRAAGIFQSTYLSSVPVDKPRQYWSSVQGVYKLSEYGEAAIYLQHCFTFFPRDGNNDYRTTPNITFTVCNRHEFHDLAKLPTQVMA